MAKCEICSKGQLFGSNVSHSNRKSNKAWKPNIRKIKIVDSGTSKTINICAKCLRSNKVIRAV